MRIFFADEALRLMAVIDESSHKVLRWRNRNNMEAVFCVDCLEDAMRMYGGTGDIQQRSGCAIYERGPNGLGGGS